MGDPNSWSWHGPVAASGLLTAMLFAMLTVLDLAGRAQPPELVDAARSSLAATLVILSARSAMAAQRNGGGKP